MAPTGEPLILASASRARAALLAAAAIPAAIEPAAIDEAAIKRACRAEHGEAADCAMLLAETKARQVSARHRQALVIGADQLLVCDGAWFDKPEDRGAARDQLRALRARTHELVTAACVVTGGTRIWQALSTPRLTMREFSDQFIDDYLAFEGEAALGSVGAYRLEGRGVQLFSAIEGDYFAVLGLPLLELAQFLRERGVLGS